MSQSFRPYPEEGADTKGTFRPLTFLRDTILNGPFQFMGLVPHAVLPFYLAYRGLKGAGYWTPEVAYLVDGLLIPLLRGMSVGGIVTLAFMRFGTQSGRLVARKRQDRSATKEEDTTQYRIEIALWSYIYLGFATILWQYFPAADGPGIMAAKRIVGKLQLGLDLGEGWRSNHK